MAHPSNGRRTLACPIKGRLWHVPLMKVMNCPVKGSHQQWHAPLKEVTKYGMPINGSHELWRVPLKEVTSCGMPH